MRQRAEFDGTPAAPGHAAGPLHPIQDHVAARAPADDPACERRELNDAIEAAIGSIRSAASDLSSADAEILDFQIAMLEDEALAAPAMTRIAAGDDAATAWSHAIDVLVEDYQQADDPYFQARVSDLRDLHDRVHHHLSGTAPPPLPAAAVLAGEDLTPSRFLSVDWSQGGGIALFGGSASSHVAMLARARAVPMVVGLGAIDLAGHRNAIIDGTSGRLVLSPSEEDRAVFETAKRTEADDNQHRRMAATRPAVTKDGIAVSVMTNLVDPQELDDLDPAICDGVGLVRTEFLFYGPRGLPDEETQFQAYKRIAEWAAPKPVVLRTLDAGGDKPITGVTVAGEANPFLGLRGIRLSLARPEIFRVQLRAMARASACGNVRIMLPMVTVPEEIDSAAAHLNSVVAELERDGVAHARPPLGIMVEVPAVAIVPELYDKAAFFSIGSNDLTQYTTAAARDHPDVAALCSAAHPAVASLIGHVVAEGNRLGRDVSLCGDMGGDLTHLPSLLASGLRSISVAPTQVGRVKDAIAGIAVTSS